jgi:RNA polymerase sigma-70 factor (ECF subfamily)
MQEVYLRVLMLKRPEAVQCPKAYLYRVAANIAHQYRLDSGSAPKSVSFEESSDVLGSLEGATQANEPQVSAELFERLDDLTRRLSCLPVKVQSALVWHYRDGYTCEEIGERLSIRRNRVKKYIAKAMARCRALPAAP